MMNDFKIGPGPVKGSNVDGTEELRDSVDAAGGAEKTSDISGTGSDSVESIAADVAAGRVGREEAVQRILADVLGSKLVDGAPDELKRELESVLNALMEDDPHLQSLIAAIGPHKIG